MHQKSRLIQDIQNKQIYRIVTRIRLANLIELNEGDANSYILQIENTTLFRKLMFPENRENKVISYEKFPRTGMSRTFYEFNEETMIDRSSFDIESLVEDKRQVTHMIKKLGIEKFEKYFLYNDGNLYAREIASQCKLTIDDVKKITDFINTVTVHSEFCNSKLMSDTGTGLSYTRIASVEIENRGSSKDTIDKFIINFSSPHFAKGKYHIDYDKLCRLKQAGAFAKDEVKEMNDLLSNLELINIRKSTIYKILLAITKKQFKYLQSDDLYDLVSFTQTELAREMGVNPSLVSRAIYGRSIVTPKQGEKPIKYFLPNNKEITKNFIKEIVYTKEDLTDERIKSILRERFNKKISRRTITGYRKELKVPACFRRKKLELV